MSDLKKNANQHARTRRDHALETAEDYVETIAEFIEEHGQCRLTDLAQRFAVSHVTVNRTLARLQRDGYVTTEKYKPIELSAKGRELARLAQRRHSIVRRFLVALGVSEKTAAVDAEGIEHHVSEETSEAMLRFIRSSRSQGLQE